MISLTQKQQGGVLLVSLVLLVVITMIGISAINTSTTNLRIVGNLQAQVAAKTATQQALEEVIGDIDNFRTPAAQTLTVNGLSVSVPAPVCIGWEVAPGEEADGELSAIDTHWTIQATTTDSATGANVTLTQGVKTRLASGSCPA